MKKEKLIINDKGIFSEDGTLILPINFDEYKIVGEIKKCKCCGNERFVNGKWVKIKKIK